MLKQFIETGKIVGTHGVKGMVRVQPWSDSGEFLTAFRHFYTDERGENRLKATKIQPHGNVVLIAFESIDSIESAERLRGKILYLDRKDARLEKGRYFIADLLGCKVYHADSGVLLGTLTDVSATGANDVWHITANGHEYLVPAVDEVIGSVEPEKETITIRPMKGIFEDED